MTTWEIDVPMVMRDRAGNACPYTLNHRPHWTKQRSNTTSIINDVSWHVRNQRIPAQEHITVQLHYAPGDNRRRDADNLVASAKPAVDALVRAGVVRDDSPQYVTQLMPAIHGGKQKRRLWLVVQATPSPVARQLELGEPAGCHITIQEATDG